MLLRSLRKAGRCGDPRTCIGNSHFPAASVAEWLRGILLPLLAIGCVGKLVLDVMLILFDGGEPVVEAGVLHLLLMIAHGLVMVAIDREGHTSSLMATRDLLIWLLLIVVEVAILPLHT